MNDILVEIQDLTKCFSSERPALKHLNIQIPKGKMVGLVGPDGAGKTTLMRLIAGLLKPTHGQIRVDGYDTIQDSEWIHYLTGYMPQKFGLYEDLTVMQNLNLYANLRNVVGDAKQEIFDRLLKFTNLSSFTDRFAKDLSGGMKQKLGLACALVKKPLLLLLDEPSVGVDPISRRELWELVKTLLGEDISVIWSTAYLDEAEKCDLVLLLHEGAFLYYGAPSLLKNKLEGKVWVAPVAKEAQTNYFQELFQDPNVVDGVIQGGVLRMITKEHTKPHLELSIQQSPPRFEDAFMDFLGGGPKKESRLAQGAPSIPKEGKPSIIAHQLVKTFDSFVAVDQVSFEVKKGEIFGLLGPNGAGKTTTFKMLSGLLNPTSGSALVNGWDLQKAPSKARSSMGYMAQKFSLYGQLSVLQNLEFFAGIYNLTHTNKRQAIEQMISIFNLDAYLFTSADMLPLGFKQRLSLACANMHHPTVLFLDEPTSGVDPVTRREFWNHINGLVAKGTTIMITTHFMDEAEYCDRIALIDRGKVVRLDTPESLKLQAKSETCLEPTLEDAFVQMMQKHVD